MKKLLVTGLVLLMCGAAAIPASADNVTWTQWSSTFSTGATAGSASGSAGAISVAYSGEVENLFFNYPSWGPAGTFDGGTVSNAPPAAGGIIQLFGGQANVTVDTITFSQAVTNPVMAIWSLGQGGDTAEFLFGSSEPFTIESGGPSNEYTGVSITDCTNAVCGAEGNGTIQFNGTFTSISWTNPYYENWYGFTVGVPDQSTAVPEPASLALLVSGLAGMGLLRRRRS